MKKLFSILVLVLSLITIVACSKGNKKDNTKTITTNSTTTEEEKTYDLGGIDFIIMCDKAQSCDPRQPQYQRLFADKKTELIDKVEKKYNIKVVYQTYPAEASWGGARERWIIDQTSLGKSPAHIYEIASYQIGTLAVQGAISPLDEYIEAYGSDLIWEQTLKYGEVLGQHYTYHDNYPLADEGIYYNADLLEEYLGAENRYKPTELWEQGNWNWDTFRELANELNAKLDENRSPENGGPQYVLGGRTYNWAYQMIGANGGHLVESDYKIGLTEDPAINALNFLHELRTTPGMWLDNAPLSNASQPEFKDGNIAFHNGQSYWIYQDNKWKDRQFDLGFVPYPTGDDTKADLSNYYINNVYGLAGYVISSAYSKSLVPEGYEDLMIHDETIFKIWADLQYFPPVDEETGKASTVDVIDDFYFKRLLPYYGDEKSREAHISIMDRSYPDLFYSMSESNNHNEAAYMIKIQDAIQNGDIRNKMISLVSEMQATLIDKYDLGEDYYD